MPVSNRFALEVVSQGLQSKDISINSEDKTYLANIPINIPPEEHL